MNHQNCLNALDTAAAEAVREPYKAQILELKRSISMTENCHTYVEGESASRLHSRDQEAAKAAYDHILATGWAPVKGGAGGPGGYRPIRKLRNKNTLEVLYLNPMDAKELLGHATDGANWEDITE